MSNVIDFNDNKVITCIWNMSKKLLLCITHRDAHLYLHAVQIQMYKKQYHVSEVDVLTNQDGV